MSIVDYVSKQASEWIGGIKRFLSFPYGPTSSPTEDYQLINKQYVDTILSSVSSSLGAISSFLTSEVIWSSTCNRLVVSTGADPAPTVNDVWIDLTRTPSIVSTTVDYTLLSTNLVVLANASGGSLSVAFGSAAVHAYRDFYIKKVDESDYPVVIDPYLGETIDGVFLGFLVAKNESLQVASDGLNWYGLNNFAEHYYSIPDTISLSIGTITAAFSANDTGQTTRISGLMDGNFLEIRETTNTPGFRIVIEFIPIWKFNTLLVRGYYYGSSTTHSVQIQLYSDVLTDYETITSILPNNALDCWQQFNCIIKLNDGIYSTGKYVSSNGKVNVRFEHTSAGNASHYFFLDYVALAYRN